MNGIEVVESRFAPRTRGNVYYGWVVLVVAALAMVATLPGRTQGLGLITEPLLRDLKSNRVNFALMNTFATLIGSAFCLVCGPLIDRVGARVVLTAVAAALGISVLAMSRVTGSLGLLVTLTLTRGFGQSALSVVSLALVGKWFVRKLPTAMGVYSFLIGIGFVAAFPGVGYAVKHFGWRQVWWWMGWVLLAGLGSAAWLLVRRTPESVGLTVDGMPAVGSEMDATPQAGLTLDEALQTAAFWAFALSGAAYGLVSTGLMLFNEAVLRERGFDYSMVLTVLGIVAFAGMVSNFLGGWLGQKWPPGRLMSAAMFLLAAALCALPLAHTKAMAYAYAVAMGVSGGIVTVVFFLCWGKLFGRAHLGAVQGAAQLLTVLASALGPSLLAQSLRLTGSSTPLMFALAPIVAVLGAFCLAAPQPALRNALPAGDG